MSEIQRKKLYILYDQEPKLHLIVTQYIRWGEQLQNVTFALQHNFMLQAKG